MKTSCPTAENVNETPSAYEEHHVCLMYSINIKYKVLQRLKQQEKSLFKCNYYYIFCSWQNTSTDKNFRWNDFIALLYGRGFVVVMLS